VLPGIGGQLDLPDGELTRLVIGVERGVRAGDRGRDDGEDDRGVANDQEELAAAVPATTPK
jgi:hypothetical protein